MINKIIIIVAQSRFVDKYYYVPSNFMIVRKVFKLLVIIT